MSTETVHLDDDADDDLDLNPDAEGAEQPVELTREQQLSRMTLRELQQICKSPEYGLSAQGKTTELIARIIKFEEEGLVDGDLPAPTELKAGNMPTPVQAVTPAAPAPSSAPAASATPAAAPVAAPVAPARPVKQKVGFFEATNTFRAEFPLGPRAQIDDPTHYQFIEGTHQAAVDAGYRTKGAPFAGQRVGFSVIRTDSGPMRSVIYEVFARQED